jgi:hypothetical protein
VKGFGYVAGTHNTNVKLASDFTEDMKKIHLMTGKSFQQ